MNRIYDFLITDKEPLFYIEKSIICMNDGFLCALNGKNGKTILSPSGVLVFLLGMGTSITQEAAIFIAQHDAQISFVRGGINIHSIFMEGRYQNPYALIKQVEKSNNEKVIIAKKLLEIRFKLLNEDKKLIDEIYKYQNIQDLIAFEGRWAKSIYKKYSIKNNISFTRDFNANDKINERLNILNNILYSICTSIIISTSLSPSVGFIHGTSRRGGFTFDLADLFKTQLIFDLAFDKKDISIKNLMYLLSNELKKDNFKIIKDMLHICLAIAGDEKHTLENFI